MNAAIQEAVVKIHFVPICLENIDANVCQDSVTMVPERVRILTNVWMLKSVEKTLFVTISQEVTHVPVQKDSKEMLMLLVEVEHQYFETFFLISTIKR